MSADSQDDNPVSQLSNKANKGLADFTGTDNLGNNINKTLATAGNDANANLSKFGNDANHGIDQTGGSYSRWLKAFMYGFNTGNFDNVGNAWNNDGKHLTANELAAKDQASAVVDAQNRDQQVAAQQALDTINTQIDSVGKRAMSTPGRAQTLLTSGYGGANGNTLLTLMNRSN